jgi:hypothetical protein
MLMAGDHSNRVDHPDSTKRRLLLLNQRREFRARPSISEGVHSVSVPYKGDVSRDCITLILRLTVFFLTVFIQSA